MTKADAAELACLAIEISGDLEAHGHVSSKLERLAASLTHHATVTEPEWQTPNHGERWEYKTALRMRSSHTPQLLNTMGAQGWELAAIAGDEFYFKRVTRKDAA